MKGRPPSRRIDGAPGSVRLIGGTWRRRVLPVPCVDGLRPTPNRVRETLFNWLTHGFAGDWSGRVVLDLFAGSGALGFEAASRGAAEVVLVDCHPLVLSQLRGTRDRLAAVQVEIRDADGLAVARRLRTEPKRFDAIFLDPPFGAGVLADALPCAAALLKADGFLYVEAEFAITESMRDVAGLEPYRADKAGEVFYHLLRRNIRE